MSNHRNARGNPTSQEVVKSVYTRTETMAILGCSMTSVIRMEAHGTLTRKTIVKPTKGGRTDIEVVVYEASEVTRQAERMGKRMRMRGNGEMQSIPEGELTAIAFEMFDRGCSLREVLVRTREPVDKVQDMYDAWLDMGGSAITISTVAQAELERFVGPFASIAELVQRVADRIGERVDLDDAAAVVVGGAPDVAIERAIIEALDVAAQTPGLAHIGECVDLDDAAAAVVDGAPDVAIDRAITLALDAADVADEDAGRVLACGPDATA